MLSDFVKAREGSAWYNIPYSMKHRGTICLSRIWKSVATGLFTDDGNQTINITLATDFDITILVPWLPRSHPPSNGGGTMDFSRLNFRREHSNHEPLRRQSRTKPPHTTDLEAAEVSDAHFPLAFRKVPKSRGLLIYNKFTYEGKSHEVMRATDDVTPEILSSH